MYSLAEQLILKELIVKKLNRIISEKNYFIKEDEVKEIILEEVSSHNNLSDKQKDYFCKAILIELDNLDLKNGNVGFKKEEEILECAD